MSGAAAAAAAAPECDAHSGWVGGGGGARVRGRQQGPTARVCSPLVLAALVAALVALAAARRTPPALGRRSGQPDLLRQISRSPQFDMEEAMEEAMDELMEERTEEQEEHMTME